MLRLINRTWFFWLWLLILLILNGIPLGSYVSGNLEGNEVLSIRLDYLLHIVMILAFAIIWVLGKKWNVRWFTKHETLKYCAVVVLAGIGLELIQLALPWRAFNPMDLLANLIGAALAAAIIIVSNRSAILNRVIRSNLLKIT